MPRVKGRGAVKRFIGRLPAEIETKLLRGAARAGIDVVKVEAAARVTSAEVREALTVTPARAKAGTVTVKLKIKGQWQNDLGGWLEYGTSPHFISVDPSQREGRSVSRINRLAKEPDGNHSLLIGGTFVGKTVFHPGARPHPFLRVSLDVKEREAIAAAQSYINARVTPGGIVGTAEPET